MYLCLFKIRNTVIIKMNHNILHLLPLLLMVVGFALASTMSCGCGRKGQQQDTTAWDYKAPPAMPVNQSTTMTVPSTMSGTAKMFKYAASAPTTPANRM